MFEELYTDSSRLGLYIDFEPYLNMDEAAKVLALIGDAAISLALVQILWQPNISNVGELTKNGQIMHQMNIWQRCATNGVCMTSEFILIQINLERGMQKEQ